MDFRQIHTFIKIAELGSFSKAAVELGYSQSAATVQIKLLEKELDAKLFDRMGKGVALTHNGELFLVHANNMVNEVLEAKQSVKPKGTLSGSLRVGTIESLCFSKFPSVLKHFYYHHPEVNLQLLTATPERLLDMLDHNQVDIIFLLDRPLSRVNWVKALEAEEEIVFVASYNSPLANRPNLMLNDILKETFFLTEQDANYRRELDTILASKSLHITPFLEFSNTEFILKLVGEGMGVSFLPRFCVEEGVKNHHLVVLKPQDFSLNMWRQVLYHKNKWVTPQMKEFIKIIS